MKKKHTNLDSLLDRNAAEQLSTVDWDKLHSDIQQRLDHAQDVSRPHLRPQTVLKWAVGLSAAAAMVMAVFVFQHDGSNGVELPSGQRSVIKLTQQVVQCDVTIIDQNGHAKKEKNRRPTWVIMIALQAEELENEIDQELAEIACLL